LTCWAEKLKSPGEDTTRTLEAVGGEGAKGMAMSILSVGLADI